MKKKLIVFAMFLVVFLTGCGKYDKEDVINDLSKKIEGINAYILTGQMEIINNEDSYKYDVNVSYLKEDNFKVSLKNISNDHEQIILKNNEGVYILTPSLNKSFKFQSSWPYNNSQVYLLQSILQDLKIDKEYTYENKDGYHIFTNNVNYPNNKALIKQVVFVDEALNIKEIQVLDENNRTMVKMSIDNIDFKATFEDEFFNLDYNIEKSSITDYEEIESVLNESIYPMYIPYNTYLTSQEVVEKTGGERIILTFDGDSPFVIIEETVSIDLENLTIPMYGELEMFTDTVGVINDKSVSWISNNVEYYVTSDVLSKDELIKIAQSISVLPVMK